MKSTSMALGPLAGTVVALGLIFAPPLASVRAEFRYTAETVDIAAHWAARSTLAHAVMFSGMGVRLEMSMDQRDAILKHAGYVARPAMPDMAMVGAIDAAGSPKFRETPDYDRPQTLRWDPTSFDRTLDPAAQAWTLIKITGPNFHLNFHDTKADRRVALMMLPQAVEQARVIAGLKRPNGLFAARKSNGDWAEPKPEDQAAVLWAASNLILAATGDAGDYWHKAYRDLVDADDYRGLASAAFAAVRKLSPKTPAGRALAVEALGRYAIATRDTAERDRALAVAQKHANELVALGDAGLPGLGLAVYGLVEASRLFEEKRYSQAAVTLFRERLLPRWDGELGAFRSADGAAASYTPRTLGALVAGMNAMRWHGPKDPAAKANEIYPRLVETILVRAGMLQASPLPLVGADHREAHPKAVFAHPKLADPEKARMAAVFAAEVSAKDDRWRVVDPRFVTAEAMFLANMLVMPREGQADAFLPDDRLTALRRRER